MFWWIVLGIVGALVVFGGVALYVVVQKETRERLADQAALGQSPEREQLLCFGALMSCRNGEVTRILLQEGKYKGSAKRSPDEMREGLIESWGINDAQSARSALQDLIVEGRRAFYDEDFKRMQSGESLDDLRSFDGDDYLRWKHAKDVWIEKGFSIAERHSMAAFDYERIAWLARSCLFAGYISEAECWRCLAWVAQQAHREFGSWEAYAASYVMGRAATYSGDGDTVDGVDAADALIRRNDTWLERPHIWQDYPLASITVPEELLVPLGEPSPVTSKDGLLGLGALMARSYGESFDGLAIPRLEADAHETWLANAWNVADKESLLERLEWFLNEGARSTMAAAFRQVAEGVPVSRIDNVDAPQVVNFNKAKEALVKAGFDSQQVACANSLLAYDIERAAYGVRLGLTVDYIDEEKVRNYLRRLAAMAHSSFKTWDEYAIAFALGQAFFNDAPDYLQRLVHAGKVLSKIISPFGQYQSPWQRFPLATLPVLQSVKPTAVVGDAVD